MDRAPRYFTKRLTFLSQGWLDVSFLEGHLSDQSTWNCVLQLPAFSEIVQYYKEIKPPQIVPIMDLGHTTCLQWSFALFDEKGQFLQPWLGTGGFKGFFSILTLLRNPPIWLVDTRKIHPQPIFFFSHRALLWYVQSDRCIWQWKMTPNFSVFTNPTHCQTQTSGETHQCSRTHVWEAQLSNEQNMKAKGTWLFGVCIPPWN